MLQQVERDERPGALVGRLLLDPGEVLGVRVLRQDGLELIDGQRVDLLHPDDRGVGDATVGPGLEQVVVDLAGAEQHPLHRARVQGLAVDPGVAEDRLEPALGEVGDRRHRELVPEQRLRREDDQRLALAGQGLAAQQVEVVRRGGGVRHPHVVLRAELQEALRAAGRVVRALALLAVREQQHQRGLLAPLHLAGREELVDDRLGAVDEVAELGLPEDQRVRVLHRVPVLEAHRRVLREQRVVDEEPRGAGGQRGDRQEVLAGLRVDDRRVPRGERATARVLTGQADGDALGEQRAERDQLTEAPVDAAVGGHLGAPVEQLLDPLVRGEALGQLDVRLADGADHVRRDRGLDLGLRLLGDDVRPRRAAGRVPGGLEDLLEAGLVVAELLLGVLHGDVAAADQLLGVELPHAALGVDDLVHPRVGHRRVVALVVTAAAVADHVDDDVLVERLPVLEGQLGHPHHGLRVVPVDVEDRGLDHPGDVGRVHRGAAVLRGGGEADLVVHDHVDRATGAVAPQLGEVQGLGDHALAGERGVAVHQHR